MSATNCDAPAGAQFVAGGSGKFCRFGTNDAFFADPSATTQ
jgi:hypothetical protein